MINYQLFLSKPKTFFKQVQAIHLLPYIGIIAILALCSTLVELTITYITTNILTLLDIGLGIFSFIGYIILSLILTFLFHGCLKVVSAKGTLSDTYTVFGSIYLHFLPLYITTLIIISIMEPFMLENQLYLIPLLIIALGVGIINAIYLVVGCSQRHNISIMRTISAIGIYIGLVIVLTIIIIIIIAIIALLLYSFSGAQLL